MRGQRAVVFMSACFRTAGPSVADRPGADGGQRDVTHSMKGVGLLSTDAGPSAMAAGADAEPAPAPVAWRCSDKFAEGLGSARCLGTEEVCTYREGYCSCV